MLLFDVSTNKHVTNAFKKSGKMMSRETQWPQAFAHAVVTSNTVGHLMGAVSSQVGPGQSRALVELRELQLLSDETFKFRLLNFNKKVHEFHCILSTPSLFYLHV